MKSQWCDVNNSNNNIWYDDNGTILWSIWCDTHNNDDKNENNNTDHRISHNDEIYICIEDNEDNNNDTNNNNTNHNIYNTIPQSSDNNSDNNDYDDSDYDDYNNNERERIYIYRYVVSDWIKASLRLQRRERIPNRIRRKNKWTLLRTRKEYCLQGTRRWFIPRIYFQIQNKIEWKYRNEWRKIIIQWRTKENNPMPLQSQRRL